MPDVFEIRDISKSFGRTEALRNVSATFTPGEIRALVGENGAGKSTLLSVIGGIQPPTTGDLVIGGVPVSLDRYTPASALQRGIAVVHQELALHDSMSAAENIFLARLPVNRAQLIKRSYMRKAADDLLEKVGAKFSSSERVENLSIANRQLVEIAKALAFEIKFLALDEPSSVLVGDELELLHTTMRKLADGGVAVAFVSHRLEEVLQVCDTYTVLKDGRVTGEGAIADTNKNDLVRLMVGRDLSASPKPDRGDNREVVLRASKLSLPGRLFDVDLDVRRGEILGIAGLVGSGRTTLAHSLFGIHRKMSGSVELKGAVVDIRSPSEALRNGIAYVPEDRKRDGLALQHSVGRNATLLKLRDLSRSRFISKLSESDLVARMVRVFKIRTSVDGREAMRSLSGGNQQKVVLAKWLEMKPDLLILDEPTRGIDIGSKEQIYDLLGDIAESGVGIIFISSELVEILALADRIAVMRDGHLVGVMEGADASEESIMALATREVRSSNG